jgi:hypothetical protein
MARGAGELVVAFVTVATCGPTPTFCEGLSFAQRRRASAQSTEEDTMERFPWHPRLRHAGTARRLVIAGVTALILAVVAAVGMAATSATPNGCPTNKSAKTAPIADLSPPARLQIVAFDVLSGPINEQTDTFTLKVRVGSTCSVDIKGASVYVTAVPYNQFSIPAEELTGDEGTATLVFRRDANFPASSKQQQLTLFIRATKPGEDPLAGVSTRRLVAVNFES